MSNLTIGVIVGSLRKASFNRQLAHALIGLLPAGATAKIIEIGELPLYNQDLDGNLPEPVQRFKAEVAGVDALLFVTPEYNRGIPGVLKNAIDWGSRPYGQSALRGRHRGQSVRLWRRRNCATCSRPLACRSCRCRRCFSTLRGNRSTPRAGLRMRVRASSCRGLSTDSSSGRRRRGPETRLTNQST